MVLNVISTVFQATIALGHVSDKQMLNERLGISKKVLFYLNSLLIEIPGELYFSSKDLLVDNHRVVVIEGINSSDHLVC